MNYSNGLWYSQYCYQDRLKWNMIIMWCKLNIKICCHLIKKKKWHPISACSSLFVYYLQKTFWHNMHSFSMFFSPSFLTEPCCYDKISLPHYCPLSSLKRLASCRVIPVEVSPVWSRSHIHKVLSPELFKNITKKSHTKLQGKRETIYFEHPEKHSG